MHRKIRNRFLSKGCSSNARMIYQKSKSYYSVLLLFLVGRFAKASIVSLDYFSSKGFFLGGYPIPGIPSIPGIPILGGIIVFDYGLISLFSFLSASSAIFYRSLI